MPTMPVSLFRESQHLPTLWCPKAEIGRASPGVASSDQTRAERLKDSEARPVIAVGI
jgi:hypothetical protein